MDSPGRLDATNQEIIAAPILSGDALASLKAVTQSILTGNFQDQFGQLDESTSDEILNEEGREERDIVEKIVEEQLAHEVILNPSIKLTQDEPQNELFKRVKETMKRAFWDGIKQELINSPPIYDRVIRMFEEIREGFASLTSKKSPGLLQRLNERLDTKELSEQLTQGNFDNVVFMGLVHFCVDYILELEAPIRADQTRRWLSSFLISVSKTEESIGAHMVILNHLPQAFEYVFDKIEEIRIDVINTQFQIAGHYLQHHGLEFERYKFASYVNSQPPETQVKIWQDIATWLQHGKQTLQSHKASTTSSTSTTSSSQEPKVEHIVSSAYIWSGWAFESAGASKSGEREARNSILRLDTRRMQQVQNQVQLCTLMATHLQAVSSHLAQSQCRPTPRDWDELRRMLYGALTSPSVSLHRLHASWKSALARLRAQAQEQAQAQAQELSSSPSSVSSPVSVLTASAQAEEDDAFLKHMLSQTCSADDPTYRLLSRRLRRLVLDRLLAPADGNLAESARTLGLAPVLQHIQDLVALLDTFVPHAIRVYRPWAALLL